MDYIKEIVRGIIIGVANVIPGVSGGTMAVSMGVYDKIIFAVTNLRKDFKNSVKTLFPYAIGAVIGIICLAFVFQKLFEVFPIPTTTLFLGLILGGVSIITNKVENEKFKITHLISFMFFLFLIIFSTIYAGGTPGSATIEFNLINCLILFMSGAVAAAAMVIPGVSGSMVLMMLGYYTLVINTITNCISALVKLDMASIVSCMYVLVPFGIGVIVGILVMAKIIEILLKRYPNATYWGILGLVVASPFAILFNLNFIGISVVTIIASLVTFAIGYIVSSKLGK